VPHNSQSFLEAALRPLVKSAEALKCELAVESLRSSGRLRLQVTGWSMMPTIRPGDIVEIERVSSECVSTGAIVLFARDGKLYVHRLIARLRDCDFFVSQGDAMVEIDPPFASSALLGRVRLISRNKKEIRPRASLSLPQRAVSSVLRRSVLASRVLGRLHTFRQRRSGATPCQP
jgi:Peptidase S24-like